MYRLVLPCLLIGTLAGCAMPADSPDTSPGVSWALAEHRHQTLSDVRYDVELSIPEARTDSILGTTTLHFTLSNADKNLVIDFNQPATSVLAVHRVVQKYEDSYNLYPADYAVVNNHIVVDADALQVGENTLKVRFVAGQGSLNRNDDFLYTLFVPDRAHFALPLFDQPNLKARYRLTLLVPPTWQAVANGPLEGRDARGDVTVYRFAETQPLPTYLFAFAAGVFQAETAERDGRTMTMYHRETDADKVDRNREALFDLHAAALAWLEAYTGIPYPFDKFDFVLIPSFQYGGMEHPGSILYRASSLMLDASATQNQYLGRASLIAHETAHMWFGDLVTMNWFDDVWTKEVFANFMAAKIVAPTFPDVNHDLRFLLAHYPSAYGIDRTAGANPIRQPLDNLQQAGTLYGAIIYQKAPIVMRHLERRVGEEAFREGLRDYLQRFSYGNATWPDLIALLDARTDDDLAAWSRVWVEEPGRPLVLTDVSFTPDDRIEYLTFVQADPWAEGRRWPQHLDVLLGYADTLLTLPAALDGEAVTVTAAEGLARPDYILPQGRGFGYGLFELDPATLNHLLNPHPDRLPDPVLRGLAWITLWEAMLSRQVAPDAFLRAALDVLPDEPDELNVQRILGYLTAAYWRYVKPTDRAARYAPEVEALLWSLMHEAERPTRKAAFFNAWRSIALTGEALDHLYGIWAQEYEVPGLVHSERDFTAMAEQLALHRPVEANAILDAQAARITNPDRQARFAFVRQVLAPDPAARDAFFDSLKDEANRAHEPWALDAVRYLNHPLRAPRSERYLLPGLALVEEIQRTGDIFFPKRWLDALLGGHQSRQAAEAVRQFLDALPPTYPPRLRNKILQSADGLFRAADILG